ncbi:MAG: RrF2 family transcriptional regulator [Gemmatimonadales bacterium]
MLSSSAEYALKAVIFMAEQDDSRPVKATDIADALNIPRPYLSKLLHELARSDVLVSTRGKHGGFALAKRPSEISLLEVVNSFDRITVGRTCLLGRIDCNDQSPCAVHSHWKAVSEQVSRFFGTTTVADLLHTPARTG